MLVKENVSPTSNAKNNFVAFLRKCKTFDDAVKVSLNDDDQTNVIILDGGNTERTIYTARLHNIAYSKNLLIKRDPNSKFYPVSESLVGIRKDDYLFFINGSNKYSVSADGLCFYKHSDSYRSSKLSTHS